MQDTVGARSTEIKTRVFISYSRKDMSFADKLEGALKARGFDVLIDREEIYAFEDWWKRLQSLIEQSDTVIFVLSPDSEKSDVALKEVGYAATLNKRFAPIVCRRVQDAAVPEALRRLNFIFFDTPDRFDASADQLAAALHTDIVWIREHTKFGEAARGWVAAGRPNGLLLRSPALEIAEYWIASRPRTAPEPTAEIEAFVAASREGARSSQRLRRMAEASIFTLLVGIILGLVGWINQSYLKEQIQWYAAVRPYMHKEFRPHVLTAEAERTLKPKDTFRECTKQCPEMVVLPAGSFNMGSPGFQHRVTISAPFAVAKFELTFAEWNACASIGACPQAANSGMGNDDQPVINVSWTDAEKYVAWLSLMTGKSYRLLSEAEYEYAARGGTQTAYPWGDQIGTNNAKFDYPETQTMSVGTFAPNGFGLYDMVGNVWEWVADCFHRNYLGAPTDGSAWMNGVSECPNADAMGVDVEYYKSSGLHVIRGGSWKSHSFTLRSDFRYYGTELDRWDDRGFRVARTLASQ